MRNRLRINLFLVLVLLNSKAANAQQDFMFSAKVKQVPSDGFYRITISPALIAKSRIDLSDIRILNKKSKFIAFVSETSLSQTGAEFRPFRIVSNLETDSTTSLIIENGEAGVINRLWLNIKNTRVARKADLSGSDDGKKWFALDEDILLQPTEVLDKDNHYETLSFPVSGYKYYKLQIYNSHKSPLNLMRVGVFRDYNKAPSFTGLPLKWISKDSSDRNTYVNLAFNERYKVDRLIVKVTSPKFYKREFKILEKRGTGFIEISEGQLSSDMENAISLSAKSKELKLVINNGDNPALEIADVQASSLNRTILAYLEKGGDYLILTGNPTASIPDYDLKYFTKESLNKVIDVQHLPLQRNSYFKAVAAKKSKDFSPMLWGALGVAGLALLFLSGKMLKEINLSNKA
ncbi:hypothetical protein [Desertivirga arenae]|uniref:hypothetical protein n=1 Tax=Desertivirga arenae TaxID=2810309 RepID=UPI001A97CDA3|nr:hypothetical protein [Pedobacter sp. SYSU D00823]